MPKLDPNIAEGLEQWPENTTLGNQVRWFHTLLNTKFPKLDPNIAEGLEQWPENTTLGNQPAMQELTDAIRSLANG